MVAIALIMDTEAADMTKANTTEALEAAMMEVEEAVAVILVEEAEAMMVVEEAVAVILVEEAVAVMVVEEAVAVVETEMSLSPFQEILNSLFHYVFCEMCLKYLLNMNKQLTNTSWSKSLCYTITMLNIPLSIFF